jgi:hypothetical protein
MEHHPRRPSHHHQQLGLLEGDERKASTCKAKLKPPHFTHDLLSQPMMTKEEGVRVDGDDSKALHLSSISIIRIVIVEPPPDHQISFSIMTLIVGAI